MRCIYHKLGLLEYSHISQICYDSISYNNPERGEENEHSTQGTYGTQNVGFGTLKIVLLSKESFAMPPLKVIPFQIQVGVVIWPPLLISVFVV